MFVHSDRVRDDALRLIAAGASDGAVARQLGLARTTVRDWRRPSYQPQFALERCPRCWQRTRPVRLQAADYAELLGLYLGDGHLTALARTQRLRIFLDARHEMIVSQAYELLRRCFPRNRVARMTAEEGAMVILRVHNNHLGCLLPQHGPGKKHERPIVLEPWQSAMLAQAPWAFLRGCIRSDGCVFVNRTGRYEYLSYAFDNLSADIRKLFIETCRRVGVECRPTGNSVRIYRRKSVALMLEHVGLKT